MAYSQTRTVADPGFPRRGGEGVPIIKVGAPTYYLAKFFSKTAWKWKRNGGGASLAPLRSAETETDPGSDSHPEGFPLDKSVATVNDKEIFTLRTKGDGSLSLNDCCINFMDRVPLADRVLSSSPCMWMGLNVHAHLRIGLKIWKHINMWPGWKAHSGGKSERKTDNQFVFCLVLIFGLVWRDLNSVQY